MLYNPSIKQLKYCYPKSRLFWESSFTLLILTHIELGWNNIRVRFVLVGILRCVFLPQAAPVLLLLLLVLVVVRLCTFPLNIEPVREWKWRSWNEKREYENDQWIYNRSQEWAVQRHLMVRIVGFGKQRRMASWPYLQTIGATFEIVGYHNIFCLLGDFHVIPLLVRLAPRTTAEPALAKVRFGGNWESQYYDGKQGAECYREPFRRVFASCNCQSVKHRRVSHSLLVRDKWTQWSWLFRSVVVPKSGLSISLKDARWIF